MSARPPRRSRRGLALVAAAGLAAAGLVGTYSALGGGRYDLLPIADPCEPRPWRDPDGRQEIAEQIVLSALDGAACDLGVPRERVALALVSEREFDAFTRERGIDAGRVEQALRQGLLRAIADGESAGALGRIEVFLLRQAAERLPLGRLIAAYRDGDLDWVGGFIS
ncbi:MAG TPA: hypothetical protein VNT51_09875 [Miltoncostaeaceae bacterium]|nr:hypothetical protein [Miltoncostaeaceae bacterium]